MRKFALLLAAALVVSAPMLATSSTDSVAAAKAKRKAAPDTQENNLWFRAFTDQLSGQGDTGTKSKRKAKRKAR